MILLKSIKEKMKSLCSLKQNKMKKLMQVDLASVATPVKVKPRKKTAKKVEVVEEEEEEERPVHASKSIKSLPEKVKKPPSEKQLAARERMKAARILKLEEANEAKEKLAKDILEKQAEVDRKKAELSAKRKQKRDALRAIVKPTITSGPIEAASPPEIFPTISQALEKLKPAVKVVTEDPRVIRSATPEPCEMVRQPPNAPKKAVRFYNYPFGKNAIIKPRFR